MRKIRAKGSRRARQCQHSAPRIRAEHHRGRFQSAATDVDCCCLRLEILENCNGNRQHVATARPSPDELFGNPTAEVAKSSPVFQLQQLYSDFCKDHGPKEDCIQSSGAGYYVVPADQGLTHNSFSGAPNGFFAPGGTAVWQAEAAFEWLLATAFVP